MAYQLRKQAKREADAQLARETSSLDHTACMAPEEGTNGLAHEKKNKGRSS